MDQDQTMMKMSWTKLAAMVGISTLIMFGLMYQLVYSAEHLMFSLNRLLASLIMGAVMTIVMLAFMWKMYEDQAKKVVTVAGAAVIALVLFLTNRSQALVDDTTFMLAMIPHHSIAINNARNATISDPRVRKLADQIIRSQALEIAEMKLLISDIRNEGERGISPLPAAGTAMTSEMRAEVKRAIK